MLWAVATAVVVNRLGDGVVLVPRGFPAFLTAASSGWSLGEFGLPTAPCHAAALVPRGRAVVAVGLVVDTPHAR